MNKLSELQNLFKPLDVLYVEDEIDLRKETFEFLKKFFTNIETASNGQEGLEKFKKKDFQIIITDLRMPKMDGRDMIDEMKKINDKIFIIVMTASDSNVDFTQSKSDIYFQKPVLITDFIEQLELNKEKILAKIDTGS